MADIKWKPSARSGNPTTIMSTDLNSLANAAGVESAEVDNDADLDIFVDLQLEVTFGSAPTENAPVEVYLEGKVDGTNYPTSSAEGRPRNGFVGSFICDNVTTLQRLHLPKVQLPPFDFKIFLLNKSGQAFPSSGTTLKGFFYKMQN
jgi:hypothetical protein